MHILNLFKQRMELGYLMQYEATPLAYQAMVLRWQQVCSQEWRKMLPPGKEKKKNIIGQSATLLSRLSKVQYNGLKLQITFKHANNFL